MTLPRFIPIALFAVLAVTTFARAAGPATRPAKPNVLFVLIDDMGYADLSCYGQTKTKTPNLDRLAKEGIRFTQYYSSAPICSPSRTALLTGQYPQRWRITSFLDNRQANARRGMADWLDPKAPSLPRILHDAGYATGHFGKWHMGGQRDVGDAPLVADYGFDKVITSFEGLGDRYLPLLDAFDGQPAKKYDLGSRNLGRGKITWIDRSTMTTAYADAAIDFIKNANGRGQPFYVNLWPDDVHSPFFPPAALRGDAAKETLYVGVVGAMDAQLGRVLDLVRNDPTLRANTVIVVASDNGPEPGAGSAGPFKGHKGNLFEGGIREPFIVWAPALMAEKAVGHDDTTSVIAGMDLAPSVLKITGVTPPADVHFDGEDRSAGFFGRDPAPRDRPIFWKRPPDRPGPPNQPNQHWPDLATRDGDWKLTCDDAGNDAKLFNLVTDVGETTDVAAQQPDRVRQMKAAVLAWQATLPKGKVISPAAVGERTDG